MVSPSAFAVFRLIRSETSVACSIGRSDGRVPLMMRSTYEAARRLIAESGLAEEAQLLTRERWVFRILEARRRARRDDGFD